jgi:hypothetical protein
MHLMAEIAAYEPWQMASSYAALLTSFRPGSLKAVTENLPRQTTGGLHAGRGCVQFYGLGEL